MSIKREDGPIKHYRMVCNRCGKQTKRYAYEFTFEHYAPPGWKELDEEDEYEYRNKHLCPKCAGNTTEGTKEIIPIADDRFDVSDHEEVYRPLIRKADNQLVIDCQDGCRLIITSGTAIKVEKTEE